MATREMTAFERACLVLAVLFLAFSAMAALQYISTVRGWNAQTQVRTIRITGVQVPGDEHSEFLVFAGDHVFRVSDALRMQALNEDPVFLFGLGREYRVRVRGETRQSFLGQLYPEILHAAPIPKNYRVSFAP